MNELKDQIEEARDRVAHCRLRAEKPSARLEDEYALEKARTRLLTLELRSLRSELKSGEAAKRRRNGSPNAANPNSGGDCGAEVSKAMRTKHKHLRLNARERAEASFAALKKAPAIDTENC